MPGVNVHAQCALIRVLAKQNLVAFDSSMAASFSEDGAGSWLETEVLGYGYSL